MTGTQPGTQSAKLLILDRDGVINEDSAQFIKSAEEWLPIEGSIGAIARLSRAGYQIVVATNQSGLARGLFDEAALGAMHQKLFTLVEEQGGRIEGIFFCPHGPDDGCDCRKPAPGLLKRIEAELAIPVEGAWFVGDSLRDIQAARAAACKPVLVKTGKGRQTLLQVRENGSSDLDNVPVHESLASFAETLLAGTPPAES